MSDEITTATSVDTTAPAPAAPAQTAAPTLAKIEAKGKGIPRSRDQIRVDYTNTAAQLGNLVFQIELMKMQKGQLLQRLDALGAEEAALPPEAKKIAPPKLVPTPPKVGADGT